VQAAVVTDPAESDAALQGMMQKYPQPWGRLLEVPEDQRPPVYFFRMESRV
jgi:hypothetical protein